MTVSIFMVGMMYVSCCCNVCSVENRVVGYSYFIVLLMVLCCVVVFVVHAMRALWGLCLYGQQFIHSIQSFFSFHPCVASMQ